MHDYSMVQSGIQLGGTVKQVVDTGTGEILSVGTMKGGPGDGGSPAGSPQVGLSTPHICTWLGGGLVSVTKGGPVCEQKGGGKRGIVQGFSRASRVRLMRRISQTRKCEIPIFVTLTYPGAYSDNPKVWKRDIRVWWLRLKRLFPGASCVWKLEFQKRGAPHFHMLVWGVSYVHLLMNVGRLWFEVVGSDDERHLHAGTRVENVRSWRGVMAYASKYLGKVESVPYDAPGRFWGVMSSDCIPWADLFSMAVSYKEACQLIRLLRRLMRSRKGRSYKSLTAFADGSFWYDRLDRLLDF